MGLSLDLGLLNNMSEDEAENGEEALRFSSLVDYLKRLEEERRKIHVFKRELPLCMILIDNVIFRLKKEAMAMDSVDKEGFGEEKRVDVKDNGYDKKVWTSSSEMWAAPNCGISSLERSGVERDDRSSGNPNQKCNSNKKSSGFKPWKAVRVSDKADQSGEVASKMTELSLISTVSAVPELGNCDLTPKISNGRNHIKEKRRQQDQRPVQGCKKKRRCWSPELHRRFVSALEQLGGCHAATPKQIRELMHLDCLSNDEVKSHLQKYRLYLQKHPSLTYGKNGFWSIKDANNDQLNSPGSRENALKLLQSAVDVSSSTSHSLETRSDGRSESLS